MTEKWSLHIPMRMWNELRDHLFPGDLDEHGAVIGTTIVRTPRGNRLLARRLFLAKDGIDYVPGEHGYRMLTSSFVTDRILDCRDDGLSYLAVHCHGGSDRVEFSSDDLSSHERGYPALSDIAGRDAIVGGLVFANSAVAGDIWLPSRKRAPLVGASITGRPIRQLFPKPLKISSRDNTYDRQTRIFGDRGQEILKAQKVGVVGAGGAGSLIVEYLSRLGVGELIVVDPDQIELSNLPRVVDSTRRDAVTWLTSQRLPALLRNLGKRLRRSKVHIARRVARRANPDINVHAICGDITRDLVAQKLVDCDYLFLAADSMQARLVVNAIVHQYLIPGVQVGAKVQSDPRTHIVQDVFSVVRPLVPGVTCLWCNGLISTADLQDEAISVDERERQRYVDDPDVVAPSVVTLNAVAAAHAVDDYLFAVTGLMATQNTPTWLRWLPRTFEAEEQLPRQDPDCTECSSTANGRLGRGSTKRLPTA